MKLTLKISFYLVLLGVLVSFFLQLRNIWGNNFPFTMDQGRDLVDIRNMVVSLSPRLVGPTTSINGVLLGPAWYYFLLPPFIISGGNPSFIVIWQIIWYQLSGIFLWFSLSKKNPRLALITTLLFLFMPVGFNANRYFWNANAMLIFTALFFGALFLSLHKPTIRKMLITGLLAGIAMQIEAAFGILFFPFAFMYFLIKRSGIKNLTVLSAGFFITLIPQALFEIRHQFIMTKVLFAEFTGEAAILGEKISFLERVAERYQELMRRISELSHFHPKTILVIFLVSLVIGIFSIIQKKSNNTKDLFFINIFFLLFSAAFYLLFSQHLKGWYVLGLSIPMVTIVALAFEYLLSWDNHLLTPLLVILLLLHVYSGVKAQNEYYDQIASATSNDPSNLQNELNALDWVYNESGGQGFKAYNYIPSVYDYNYHYLYWWYGPRRFGFQPSEVAYLPNQPEYIPNQDLLWTKAKPTSETSPVFLIIETDNDMPEREQKWLGNFSSLCQEKEIIYPFGLKIKKMTPVCQKQK